LLTLTGAGGCGKTRLALHVASELLDEFRDGMWLVDLSPLSEPNLIAHTVAASWACAKGLAARSTMCLPNTSGHGTRCWWWTTAST
jgi:predicted ATPase